LFVNLIVSLLQTLAIMNFRKRLFLRGDRNEHRRRVFFYVIPLEVPRFLITFSTVYGKQINFAV